MTRSVDEHDELARAKDAVIAHLPRISRGVINATLSSKPLGERKRQFAEAIAQTRKLLDELLLHQVRLEWRDERSGGSAA